MWNGNYITYDPRADTYAHPHYTKNESKRKYRHRILVSVATAAMEREQDAKME